MRIIILLIATACIGCTAPVASLPTEEQLIDWQRALREDTSQILAATTDTRDTLRANTEALQAIKTQLEASLASPETVNSEEVIQSEELSPADERANDSQPVTGSVAESAGVPLWVSTTTNCPGCERLKRDLDAGKFDGFDVRFVSDWDPKGYPAIRFEDSESSTGYSSIFGYTSSTLPWLRARLLGEQRAAQVVARSSSATPMQHRDMVALHNSLHGGGSWTWPGDLATHLREAHGVNLSSRNYNQVRYSSPVVRSVSQRPVYGRQRYVVSQRACPTGACP